MSGRLRQNRHILPLIVSPCETVAVTRRNWRIAGAVCRLLTAIGIIGFVF